MASWQLLFSLIDLSMDIYLPFIIFGRTQRLCSFIDWHSILDVRMRIYKFIIYLKRSLRHCFKGLFSKNLQGSTVKQTQIKGLLLVMQCWMFFSILKDHHLIFCIRRCGNCLQNTRWWHFKVEKRTSSTTTLGEYISFGSIFEPC